MLPTQEPIKLSHYKPMGLPPEGLKPAEACGNCENYCDAYDYRGYCKAFDFPCSSLYTCNSYEAIQPKDSPMYFAEPKLAFEPVEVTAAAAAKTPEPPVVTVVTVEQEEPADSELYTVAGSVAEYNNADRDEVYKVMYLKKYGEAGIAYKKKEMLSMPDKKVYSQPTQSESQAVLNMMMQASAPKPTAEEFLVMVQEQAAEKFADPDSTISQAWINVQMKKAKAKNVYE